MYVLPLSLEFCIHKSFFYELEKAEFAPFRWKRSIELIGIVVAGIQADLDQSGMTIFVGQWATTDRPVFKTRFLSADRELLLTKLTAVPSGLCTVAWDCRYNNDG